VTLSLLVRVAGVLRWKAGLLREEHGPALSRQCLQIKGL